MSSSLLRRALLTALVLLSGCAVLEYEAEGWEARPSHKPLTPYYIVSDDVASACGIYGAGLLTHGCARRDYASGLCIITTGPNPPEWLLVHERRHCAGFNHAAPIAFPFIAYRR